LTSFFDNKNPNNCPVKACHLKAFDCTSPYTSLALKIGKEYPFPILVGPKATPNKEEKFCIHCVNGFTAITYNKLAVI